MMETVLVESINEVKQLRSEWDNLVERYPGKNPFLLHDWMVSWLETLGKDVSLLVITVRDANVLFGIAPLCVQEGGLLTFIGYPRNDYADFIVDPSTPNVLEKLVAGLISFKKRWSRALLDQFPQENSQWPSLIKILENKKIFFRLESSEASNAMIIRDVEAAKKQYYKRNIKSYINWFKKKGKLDFSVDDDENTVTQGLEDLFSQHIDRYKGTATPSSFLKDEMKEFHRKFVERMRPKEVVRVASLRFNEKPLAVELFFEYNKTMYLYKGGFDLNFYKKSPGQISTRCLFDYAVERGVREIDFTRGDEKYKGRFTNTVRQNHRITLYRNRVSMLAAKVFCSFRHSRFFDILFRNEWARIFKYSIMKFYHRNVSYR